MVDGSGEKGLLRDLTNYIGSINLKHEVNGDAGGIEIIDKYGSGLRDFSSTVIISRKRNRFMAEIVAELLKIDKKEVIFKEMPDNRKEIDVTLVLGKDFKASLTKIISNQRKESDS